MDNTDVTYGSNQLNFLILSLIAIPAIARDRSLRFDVFLTLLHSKRPKLYTVLAFLSAKGLSEI